jgi:DNA (cytosine-5)-methyltransferase 1
VRSGYPQRATNPAVLFEVVLLPLKFIDLFAGLGGFHLALDALGHTCVFASEIDDELRGLYVQNFPEAKGYVVGDIKENHEMVPPHDILCAGFPCQPFSKSGYQDGRFDTRGTLFHDIVAILKQHRPTYVVLENVGNFEQHDGGRTWAVAKGKLQRLGYTVVATEHVKSGGHGLLSPHHLGFPHARERFYAVCKRGPLSGDVLPVPDRPRITDLRTYMQAPGELTERDLKETRLTASQVACIAHWNSLLEALPPKAEFPSFPLWSDEFGATYSYEDLTPFKARKELLLNWTRRFGGVEEMTRRELIDLLPSYARDEDARFSHWKVRFITQNRDWYARHRRYFPADWLSTMRAFPASLRKLEWNCRGEDRDLWAHVLQFRPSGLRVKRMRSIPALVALTTTQIPIIGPARRYITRSEALRLQGFPADFQLPPDREGAFRALGNAIHVEVATVIAARLFGQDPNSFVTALSPNSHDPLPLASTG